MSENQTYEFLALDKPLSAKDQAALRKMSSRAEISANRFFNEYSYGDLRGDPVKLMERYFDVHLHVADFGDRRFMLRLPVSEIDTKRLRGYFPGELATARVKGDHVVIDLQSPIDDGYETWNLPADMLEALIPLRLELLRGDLRPAYLAWLYEVQFGEMLSEKLVEPEVPRGLAELSDAQDALVELFAIDAKLISAAAKASQPLLDETGAMKKWFHTLSISEKDAWLRRAIDNPELALGAEMFRKLRVQGKPVKGTRTVGELRTAAGMDRE